MTVRELIERLEKMQQDLRVTYENDYLWEVDQVTEVWSAPTWPKGPAQYAAEGKGEERVVVIR